MGLLGLDAVSCLCDWTSILHASLHHRNPNLEKNMYVLGELGLPPRVPILINIWQIVVIVAFFLGGYSIVGAY